MVRGVGFKMDVSGDSALHLDSTHLTLSIEHCRLASRLPKPMCLSVLK